jgi:hypothetical protein
LRDIFSGFAAAFFERPAFLGFAFRADFDGGVLAVAGVVVGSSRVWRFMTIAPRSRRFNHSLA